MGKAASRAWERVAGRSELRFVIAGLDAAGKTTILYRLKLNEVITTIPTIGFNVETIEHGSKKVTLLDAGLRSKARPLIKHYLAGALDGLIFVVDANDRERFEDSSEFLHYCLESRRDADGSGGALPRVLLLANKADLPKAASAAEVLSAMELDQFKGLEVRVCSVAASQGPENLFHEHFAFLEGKEPTEAFYWAHPPAKKWEEAAASPAASSSAPGAVGLKVEGESEEEPRDDEAFLAAVEAGAATSSSPGPLRRLSVEGLLRFAYLDRVRAAGYGAASARMTFEVARRLGFIEHATRAWFWIALVYRLPLQQRSSETSLQFLERNAALLPSEAAQQEELIGRAYSAAVLADPAAALAPLPPDCPARADPGAESDEAFLRRVEAKELDAEEPFGGAFVPRLAFAALRACATRREAIKRMDAALRSLADEGWAPFSSSSSSSSPPTDETASASAAEAGEVEAAAAAEAAAAEAPGVVRLKRPFHETRQYVTLHLVHAAIATRAELADFAELSAACPELCEGAVLLQYYSEAALETGAAEFVPPDRQPLPSVLQVPQLTWHDELDDASFLEAIGARSLGALGTPSLVRCAYLRLREGRRSGMDKLLAEISQFRGQPGASRFAHETLAFFCMHMVHFYAASSSWSLDQPFASFASSCGQALDPFLYKRHYSEALLFSEPASTGLLLPDLCPLPSLLPSAPAPRASAKQRAA